MKESTCNHSPRGWQYHALKPLWRLGLLFLKIAKNTDLAERWFRFDKDMFHVYIQRDAKFK